MIDIVLRKGEPDVGTIIDSDDILAVTNELTRMKEDVFYDHHQSIEAFENTFKNKIGNKYALSISSCGVGIDMVLKALSLSNTDEVISCAINFHGTHLSILNTGAKLILSEPNETLNIDVNDVMKRITSKTKAIVVTHMNGLSCDMDYLRSQLSDHVFVVEDVARSCGSRYKGKYIGSDSWVAIYSFQYKKHITTLGEGGMILTCDNDLRDRLLKYRSFGMGVDWGTNYKLTSIQAAFGTSQLSKLDMIVERRRAVARIRTTNFKDRLPNFILPVDNETYYNAYYTYTMLTPAHWTPNMRDSLIHQLKQKYNIEAFIANRPTYQTNPYIFKYTNVTGTPYADYLGDHIVCLCIHPLITEVENQYIVDKFIEVAQKIN